MGHIKEEEAKGELLELYDYVKKTKYQEYYDYLVKKGTTEILIEVKWVECRYKTATLYFRCNQLKKLLKAKDFLVYVKTTKGNFFISPSQIYKYAHVHYNQLNPTNCFSVCISAFFNGINFTVKEPEHCLLCSGKLIDWIKTDNTKLLQD